MHLNRRNLSAGAATLLLGAMIAALSPGQQPKRHRLVIELTGEPAAQWESVLNNAENVRRALAPDPVEVTIIVHGKALPMLLRTNSAQSERMAKMAAGGGVTFAACQNSMRRMNVQKSDLFDFATTVDSGVAEVVRKQEAGWAYVKGGG